MSVLGSDPEVTPPRYVAVVHVTRSGEIEAMSVCDNRLLQTQPVLLMGSLPDWVMQRVALMRFYPREKYAPEMRGRKYSDYMIALHLTTNEFKQLIRTK
jgi:hypothetical protein